MKYKVGDQVIDIAYPESSGQIIECFNNWKDLCNKNTFVTAGDPDLWLSIQEILFTPEQLEENWYTIHCFAGGAIWTCESRLGIYNMN